MRVLRSAIIVALLTSTAVPALAGRRPPLVVAVDQGDAKTLAKLLKKAKVSDAVMDVSNDYVKGTGCKIEKVERTKSGVVFTRTDDTLPMPVQKDWVSVLPYTNQLADLNWYGLTVKGFSPETRYNLAIDGVNVGTFTGAELANGVNLGNLTSGPIHEQGQKVLQAINAKNQVVAGRFGVLRFNAPDWLADVAKERRPLELAKRMERVDMMQADVYKLAQPTARQWALIQTK